MTQWKNVGAYLGRKVQIARCDHNSCSISAQSLADSLLLVMLGVRFDDESTRRRFLSALIHSTPLAIVVFGTEARPAFDTLINVLSQTHSTKHTMTKLLEERTPDDAIRDFFQATWPAEEQFDDWQKYSVILVGMFQEQEVAKSIESVCQ